MPKPVALTPALVEAPQITPQAATSARSRQGPKTPEAPADAAPSPPATRRGEGNQDCRRRARADRQRLHACMLPCLHEVRQAWLKASR